MLGCLLRTPSPEAKAAPNLSNLIEAIFRDASLKAALKNPEKEIIDLRARLA